MPKILRIINRFNIGGPTLNAGYLTSGLADSFETRLIGGVPNADEAHSGFMLAQMGVGYEELQTMSRKVSLFSDYQSYAEIARIIRDWRPDIVHTHASKAGALGRLAAMRNGVPVIVHTYHGHVFDGYFKPWVSRAIQSLERYLGRHSQGIIAISELQKEDLVSKFRIVSEHKTRVIRLGFDLERFGKDQLRKRMQFRAQWQIDDEEVAIGIVGRIAPIKNHGLFAEVSAITASAIPDKKLVFVIVGDGNGREELEAKMHLSLQAVSNSRVIFTSWQEKMDEVMNGLDIVVLTSHQEGTPVSLIEAQAAEKAIVSTRVGGVADCVPAANHHLLVASGDAEKMSRTIVQLIENTTYRMEAGIRGKDFVTGEYGKENLVERTKSFYEELLGSRI